MATEPLNQDELNKLIRGPDSPKIVIKGPNDPSKIRLTTIVLSIIIIVLIGIIIYLFMYSKTCMQEYQLMLQNNLSMAIPMSQTLEYTELMKSILANTMWTGTQLETLRTLLRKYITHKNLDIVISVNDYSTMALLLIFGGNKQLTDEILDSVKFSPVS